MIEFVTGTMSCFEHYRQIRRFSFQQTDLDRKITRFDLRDAVDVASVLKMARQIVHDMAIADSAGKNLVVVMRDEIGAQVFETRLALPPNCAQIASECEARHSTRGD